MSDDLLAGIDCGATKVMVQSGVYSSKTNKISPGPMDTLPTIALPISLYRVKILSDEIFDI